MGPLFGLFCGSILSDNVINFLLVYTDMTSDTGYFRTWSITVNNCDTGRPCFKLISDVHWNGQFCPAGYTRRSLPGELTLLIS